VAEMGVARFRANFGADSERVIDFLHDPIGLDRLGKTRPARAAFEFVQRAEERLTADNVDVNTSAMIVPVLVLKWWLGAVFPGDVILQRSQARTQFGVSFGLGRILLWFCGDAIFFLGPGQEREGCRRADHGEQSQKQAGFPRVVARFV
jgi:hypothetical protein